MTTMRITRDMVTQALFDLGRPHPFALERVGFLSMRRIPFESGELLLASQWHAVPDDGYLEDRQVGARISSATIRMMLALCLDEQIGMLHVHCHDHMGRPSPSEVDDRTFAELTPAFLGAAPTERHGAMILSRNDACGRLLGADVDERLGLLVIGRPLELWGMP